MGRRKRKGASNKRKKLSTPHQPQNNKKSTIKKTLSFLAASGLLVALMTSTSHYLLGDVYLEFTKPIGRAYEFKLINNSPTDKQVIKFRITIPEGQTFSYLTTKDIYVPINPDGTLTLPFTYVPAAEFNELDGRKLRANSETYFRIPPMSNASMQPDAAIVDVHFDYISSNYLFKGLEKIMTFLGFRDVTQSYRYLVIENYWIESQSKAIDEAIRIYCRDNNFNENTLCNEKSY